MHLHHTLCNYFGWNDDSLSLKSDIRVHVYIYATNATKMLTRFYIYMYMYSAAVPLMRISLEITWNGCSTKSTSSPPPLRTVGSHWCCVKTWRVKSILNIDRSLNVSPHYRYQIHTAGRKFFFKENENRVQCSLFFSLFRGPILFDFLWKKAKRNLLCTFVDRRKYCAVLAGQKGSSLYTIHIFFVKILERRVS